ncbi:Bug family tripartite tricarboxylate transporter substrate binding protein [Paracidovorax valerianellae]|uniref:Tripartite-type tricarboxylate transporter, receptor component TctC n=1 Tax=Paracidovorax valerianellae TaxID=187868 RepID=A0A1G6L5F5_9BURK|nr:tripartite tricarboxylate transporter substrate-binding protein [Paracidovorax valerianellae]MDA8446492.1 tripartite tricarboxylate transporter substrate-binding protein [Paracidovorax valerianellae]SDC38353.1 Tripartite-type tricarboxylate transporter, receptor component TctC [Paracidovorax valerianellae]
MTLRSQRFWRLGIFLACLALASATSRIANAQDFPSKPITIVVPFPAGGGTDVVFRSISPKLQAALGPAARIVIDNRAGAGGTVGTASAAKATPDGYTLIAATTTTIASAQAVYPKLGYDPNALVPIGLLGTTPFVLVTAPGFPVRTLAEFIAHAKAHPGKINYASIGNGSASHLVAELFKQRAGVEMTHVPYRGAGPAQTDLMAGQVQVLFDNPTALVQQVRAGRMQALAITESSAVFQDLPTFAASGMQGFRPELWYGLMAPAATPEPVIQHLHAALSRVLEDREVRADLLARGVAPAAGMPQAFAQRIRADIDLWGGIARSVGAKVE